MREDGVHDPLERAVRGDLRVVHRALLAAGRVSWIGEPLAASSLRLAGSEMTRTLNRLRDLLRERPASVVPRDAQGTGGAPVAEFLSPAAV